MNDFFYLLYRFEQNDIQSACYKPITYFTKDGPISKGDYQFSDYDLEELAFLTKEELVEFTKIVLEQLGKREAYILSANDFNIGLESVHNKEEFSSIFQSYGTQVISNNKLESSKGLFGRFF